MFTRKAVAQDNTSPVPFVQTGIIPPELYFTSRLAGSIAFTPVAQGGRYTTGDLQQAVDGRYFVLVAFSPTGVQTLGLLVSSFDSALLLDYLNALQIHFQAVAVPPGVTPGLGTEKSFGDDGFGWIHGISACGPNVCAVDSNFRRMSVWSRDGKKHVGTLDLKKLFGVSGGAAWINDVSLAKDGALFVPVGQDREGGEVAEGLLFRVTGL